MPQKRLEEWISPQEASLVMSLLRGVYISPDDIKQARRKKLSEDDYIQPSETNTVYRREAIEQLEIRKRHSGAFFGPVVQDKYKRQPVDIIANWLKEFPHTIEYMEARGYKVPMKEEALRILAEKKRQKGDSAKATKSRETHNKTP